ncbi:MAG: winged helix-turn-helix domain-containing protein [Kiloniellales bacterium]
MAATRARRRQMGEDLAQDPGEGPLRPPLVVVGVEDASIRSFLAYILKQSGFRVLAAGDGKELTGALEREVPAVVLFETPQSGLDAAALCTALRVDQRTRETVIIVMTPPNGDEEQADLLNAGADACLTKPVLPEALIAHIRAALRRAGRSDETGALLTFADLEMDLVAYRVRRGGREIRLAPTEFRLLQHLMQNPRRVYTRQELQNAAWPPNVHLGPRTVDVHVGRLRQALKSAGGKDLIRTVRSVGYALSD